VKPADPPPVKVDPVPQEDPAAKQRQLELQRQADAQRAVAEAQQALLSNRIQEAKRAAQRALTLDPQNDRARAILSDIRERENAESEIRRDKQLRLQAIQTATITKTFPGRKAWLNNISNNTLAILKSPVASRKSRNDPDNPRSKRKKSKPPGTAHRFCCLS
jgi:hypothetical protein